MYACEIIFQARLRLYAATSRAVAGARPVAFSPTFDGLVLTQKALVFGSTSILSFLQDSIVA